MKSYSVNLLPKRKRKVADKLLYFILYYFRYIIIITQIVVIGVFFFRFREDQKIIDLKQKFRQKQQILAVTAPIVEEASEVQKKTAYVKVILGSQDTFIEKYQTILSVIPQDVTLSTLDISDTSIKIQGTSTDVSAIRSLHRKLVLIKGFENAEIGTINAQPDGTFQFIIEIAAKAVKK